jgi:hypothetical protein
VIGWWLWSPGGLIGCWLWSPGGLGLSETDLVAPLSTFGVTLMMFSGWGYAPLQRLFGTLALTRAGLLGSALACFMFPLVSVAQQSSHLVLANVSLKLHGHSHLFEHLKMMQNQSFAERNGNAVGRYLADTCSNIHYQSSQIWSSVLCISTGIAVRWHGPEGAVSSLQLQWIHYHGMLTSNMHAGSLVTDKHNNANTWGIIMLHVSLCPEHQ